MYAEAIDKRHFNKEANELMMQDRNTRVFGRRFVENKLFFMFLLSRKLFLDCILNHLYE